MKKMKEILYSPKKANALEQLTEGLINIQNENKELFKKIPFSKCYLIKHSPNAMFVFTEESINLPYSIIEQVKDLCKDIAIEVANQ
ncbi:MAG: hypothetical protein ACOYMA_20295 [Bacteroidia bacterium]